MTIKVYFFLLASIFVFSSNATLAGPIESLMMPGKLIEGHEKYENDCNNCHEKFSKKKQSRLCRQCHKRINKEIRNHTGYHGRIHNISTIECKTCHTDHKGRGMDIIKFDKQAFNHKLTDFALKGKHRLIACDNCHRSDKEYYQTPTDCFSCHKNNDIHNGKLGKKCQQCHTSDNWQEAHFDHDKTDFKLSGIHKKTDCINCHINQRYKKTPAACHQCHINKDIHKGTFGLKCGDCHQTEKWTTSTFRHNKETSFNLNGQHKKIRCEACHIKDPYKNKTSKQCVSCHRKDDIHKGVFGKKCDSCHSENNWLTKQFNHNRDTDFPLRNKHKQLRCDQCHQTHQKKNNKTRNCYSCHRNDDIHKGDQGKQCESCHNDNGWSDKIAFDHDISNFPLIGLHASVACEDCHSDASYSKTPSHCISCHQQDDVHKKTFGKQCNDCHNPNAWNRWDFDHDQQTDFKLKDSHKNLDCHACHVPGSNASQTGTQCISCHAKDDIHNGSFGSQCAQCHTQDTFSNIQMLR